MTPKITPNKIQTVPPSAGDWNMRATDKIKYEQLFEKLEPASDGLLSGNKVRNVLMESKLPLDVLSKIWDLADQDKDGSLDKHEFLVVSYLLTVYDFHYVLIFFGGFFFVGHASCLPGT